MTTTVDTARTAWTTPALIEIEDADASSVSSAVGVNVDGGDVFTS